jgi:hypothetical protein
MNDVGFLERLPVYLRLEYQGLGACLFDAASHLAVHHDV